MMYKESLEELHMTMIRMNPLRWCWKNYNYSRRDLFFSERKIEPQLFSDIKLQVERWESGQSQHFFQFQHSQIHPVFIAFRTSGRPRLDPVRPGRWRAYLPCCHQVGVIWRWLHRCIVFPQFLVFANHPNLLQDHRCHIYCSAVVSNHVSLSSFFAWTYGALRLKYCQTYEISVSLHLWAMPLSASPIHNLGTCWKEAFFCSRAV